MVSHTKAKRTGSFLSGTGVLTLAALVVKVIGLCYRIPLLSYLGTEGMGYFNTAYEVYALLCVISTAGLPVAMSVLISSAEAEGKGRMVKGIYRSALWLFVVVGAVGSLALGALAAPLATWLKNPAAMQSIRMISPTVFFICLSSAFRGYFQGKRNMVPTALSQVIEALGKLLLGLLFASMARSYGADLPTTAGCAVLGVTIGTALSVIYLYVHKRLTDARHPDTGRTSVTSARSILRRLLTTAIPVTISAGVISLTKCIDMVLILRRLQDAGMGVAEANAHYGCYSTLAVPVFNILPSLTTSVALSAVPALSAALGKGRNGQAEVRRISLSAWRMTLWSAIPAALGLSVLAEDVLTLIFRGQPEAVAMAAPWLACLALSVPASCLITVTGAMLQACGHAERTVISMIVGATAKTVMAYFLLGRSSVGLMGAPISSLVCDVLIVVVNLIFIARLCPAMLPCPSDGGAIALLPTTFATLAIGSVCLLRRGGGWESITSGHTLAAVIMVMCLYSACMIPLILKVNHPKRNIENNGTHDERRKSRPSVGQNRRHLPL